jgi:hypothetical protein
MSHTHSFPKSISGSVARVKSVVVETVVGVGMGVAVAVVTVADGDEG